MAAVREHSAENLARKRGQASLTMPRFRAAQGLFQRPFGSRRSGRQDAVRASSRKMGVESAVEAYGQGVHPLPKSQREIMNIGATGKAT
jgi:hypothetical protein